MVQEGEQLAAIDFRSNVVCHGDQNHMSSEFDAINYDNNGFVDRHYFIER